MPLTTDFFSVAQTLAHPGMGTENVGPLLYALTCMRRPCTVIAVGLGYSTLFLLQALADIEREEVRDLKILREEMSDPLRREVLSDWQPEISARRLIGIDDFSDDKGRLMHLQRCVKQLEFEHFFELHNCRYQEFSPLESSLPVGLTWIDCGHQIEYADLCNRFWPMVDEDGGLLGIHYTHVDIQVKGDDGNESVVIAGPWVNAAKRQMLLAGMAAGYELLSIVEPHKQRQGSVTLLRKIDCVDRCRDNSLAQEQKALYSDTGVELQNMSERGA